VLAAELAAADGDHQVAFQRYQHLLRPYVAKGQRQARGSKDFLAPPTATKIAQLQRFYKVLPYLPVKTLIKHLTTRTATGIKLPDYCAPEAPGLPGRH
jgi:2-polyprenyl-6-methoxyphenol hydroxylase-like FAD-dependent oxidoreductase